MSRKEDTSADFFLAGRRLPWFAVAISLFATNISSGSLIGLAGDGYRFGMAVGTLEWMAVISFVLLTFIFLPYYQRRSVYTMPEFMEQRYNVGVRLLFSGTVLTFETMINIPFLLFTGGLAIEVMFGVPLMWAIVAIGIFVGVYTVWGGLGAVVWTDVVQGCLMILGSTLVTLYGLQAIGGIGPLMTLASEKMHVVLPSDHPAYPFPATMLGGFTVLGVYYSCLNQTMVQRVLGARTEWDARMGSMAACYIKLMLPFVIVLPGIITFVLFPNLEEPDKALPLLINSVVPAGLSGLVLAAVVASLMSSADSSLNAWATLFVYDFYHRLIDKKAHAKRLILVGRSAIVLVLVAAAMRAPMLRGNESIVQYFLNGLAYIAGPISVISMVGIFWRRATSTAALVTLITAPGVCYLAQHMKAIIGWGPDVMTMVHWLPIAVAGSLLVMIVVSLYTKPKEPTLLEGLIWSAEDTLMFGSHLMRRRDQEGIGSAVGASRLYIWKDYRVVGSVALVLMVAMVWYFR